MQALCTKYRAVNRLVNTLQCLEGLCFLVKETYSAMELSECLLRNREVF